MKNLPIHAAFAALLATAAAPALAQPAPASASRTATLTAIVETIDQTKRQVLLRAEDGRLTTLTLAPTVRNLAQVKSGDQVVISYQRAVAAAIAAPGPPRAPLVAGELVGRNAPGERPGAGAAQFVRVRVRIDAASATGDSVSFTGPRGNHVVLEVADPAMQGFVRGLRAGQQVDIAYAEAIALEVKPAAR